MRPEEFVFMHACAAYAGSEPSRGSLAFREACRALKALYGSKAKQVLGLSDERWALLCDNDVCDYYAMAVLAKPGDLSPEAIEYVKTFLALVSLE